MNLFGAAVVVFWLPMPMTETRVASCILLKGRLCAHRFDKRCLSLAARDISFRFTGSEYVTRCVTEEAGKAPTAGPEGRSCCRSVLLMNYDAKLQDLKRCQVKRIFQTRFIFCLVSLCSNRQKKGPSTHFLKKKSPICCSMEINSVFLFSSGSVHHQMKSKHFVSVH